MNRRHLLAGAAALPVAGLTSAASATAADPAVRAFAVWRDAWKGSEGYLAADVRADDDPETDRLQDAEWQTRKVFAETVATTPAGIACQLWLALDIFGEPVPQGSIENREDCAFSDWKDELNGKIMRNMLTAAELLD